MPRSGICPKELITSLVVDECHRATGKADIVLAIRTMREAGIKFRILGLSATPGKDRANVQARHRWLAPLYCNIGCTLALAAVSLRYRWKFAFQGIRG